MAEKNKVAFYRGAYGTSKNWVSSLTDLNGVYFNTDTKTLAMGGVEYDGFDHKELDKMIRGVDLANGQLVYEAYDKVEDKWTEVKLDLIKATDNSVTVTPVDDEDFGGVEIAVNATYAGDNEDGLKLGEDGLYVDLTKTQEAIETLKAIEYTGEEAITVDEDKKITLVIEAGNKLLSQGENGLTSTLSLNYDKENKKIKLLGIDSAEIASIDTDDFVVDGFLASVEYEKDGEEETDNLVFTWNTDAGLTETKINLAKYIDIYTAGNGIDIVGKDKAINVKLDSASETFLTVGADGVKLSGVQDAIDAALTWNEKEVEEEVVE